MITGKNYIGNRLSALGNKTYRTFNPKLNIENEHTFIEASQDEIDEAAALAAEAVANRCGELVRAVAHEPHVLVIEQWWKPVRHRKTSHASCLENTCDRACDMPRQL